MTKDRLPEAAYRTLATLALRRLGPLTKGQLAWEIRANHPMVTRVLAKGMADGHFAVARLGDGSYRIQLTQRGQDLSPTVATLLAMHETAVQRHFRFGKKPDWLPAQGSVGE